MLHSYKEIPFDEVYLFILLDREFAERRERLDEFIRTTFSRLEQDKIHITYDRFKKQHQWAPFMKHITEKHGENELVWFSQNDDQVFVDFNMDILNEGIQTLKSDPNPHKSIYLSHWPEIIKASGKYRPPTLTGNYIKFDLSLLDSIQIFSMKLLYDIFVEYHWKSDHHMRIDSILGELMNIPSDDNPLSQTIFAPLRELVRHFDGYDHVKMDRSACPPLELPVNTFYYSPENLSKKMTASHKSIWNNSFEIPQEWLDINQSLHPPDLTEYSLFLYGSGGSHVRWPKKRAESFFAPLRFFP
jgi:hypothetical protein